MGLVSHQTFCVSLIVFFFDYFFFAQSKILGRLHEKLKSAMIITDHGILEVFACPFTVNEEDVWKQYLIFLQNITNLLPVFLCIIGFVLNFHLNLEIPLFITASQVKWHFLFLPVSEVGPSVTGCRLNFSWGVDLSKGPWSLVLQV